MKYGNNLQRFRFMPVNYYPVRSIQTAVIYRQISKSPAPLEAQEYSASSFGFTFEIGQMGVELVLGDSLAAIKLFKPAPNLVVNRSILGKPAVLLFLRLQ